RTRDRGRARAWERHRERDRKVQEVAQDGNHQTLVEMACALITYRAAIRRKPDKARHYTIARGSAMESASHLDVMKVGGLFDDEQYAQGIVERVVAMLTRLIDP